MSGEAVAVFIADVMHMYVGIHLSCCVYAHLGVEKDAWSREPLCLYVWSAKNETVQTKCVQYAADARVVFVYARPLRGAGGGVEAVAVSRGFL